MQGRSQKLTSLASHLSRRMELIEEGPAQHCPPPSATPSQHRVWHAEAPSCINRRRLVPTWVPISHPLSGSVRGSNVQAKGLDSPVKHTLMHPLVSNSPCPSYLWIPASRREWLPPLDSFRSPFPSPDIPSPHPPCLNKLAPSWVTRAPTLQVHPTSWVRSLGVRPGSCHLYASLGPGTVSTVGSHF